MNLLHHGVRKFEVQLNSTDAAGLFEEWGFHCCGLSFGRPTRERPAAVSGEAGGGWAVGFSPSRPHSVITLVIYNVQKTNAMSAETSPQPMP